MKEPEELERGNERRTTASLSWAHGNDARYVAATAAVGHRRRVFDTNTAAFLAEATLKRMRGSVYTRVPSHPAPRAVDGAHVEHDDA